jgi:hypothetical protein
VPTLRVQGDAKGTRALTCRRCGEYPLSLLPVCGPCQQDLYAQGSNPEEWLRSGEVIRRVEGVPHGRYSTYTNHRCRCPECTLANTEYMRAKIRDGTNGRPVGAPGHFEGCTCTACSAKVSA